MQALGCVRFRIKDKDLRRMAGGGGMCMARLAPSSAAERLSPALVWLIVRPI